MLHLQLATESGKAWAQKQVTDLHYLRKPVDTRCSVLAYLVTQQGRRVGCLIFGRPESTCCYQGGLTYGSLKDVRSGRAEFSRWEILNLARVWLDPCIQKNGAEYVQNAATCVIGQALKCVVFDYLSRFHPIKLNEPWRIRQVLSYCDTRIHNGSIYRAAGFRLARTNEEGIQTWVRAVRGLQGHERKHIEKMVDQSPRSRAYRSKVDVDQFALDWKE